MQDGEFSGLLRPVVEHVQPRCQPLRRLRRGWRRRGPRLPDIGLRRREDWSQAQFVWVPPDRWGRMSLFNVHS